MTSLWDRVEPLLWHVAKPARYIGGEDGSFPDDKARGRRAVAALLPRHLRDRPTQPGPPDPLLDPERARRRRRGALLCPVVRHGGGDARGGHPPVLRRDDASGRGVRRHRLQPLRRAHLHERPQHARPRRRRRSTPPSAARPTRSCSRAGTAPTTPSRSPTSSTPRPRRRRGGRERAARRDRRVARRPARAARPPPAAPRARERSRASTSRASTRPATRTAGSCGYDAADGAPATVEKRTVADLADWPYPRHQLVPLTEVVHDRLNVEVFRGLHARAAGSARRG